MDLLHWISVFFNLMSVIEWIAFFLNVICVYLIVLEKDVNWPIGILGSIALAIVFWKTMLFANFWLQIFYVVEGIYGWWMWTRREKTTGLKLIRIGKTKWQTAGWLTAIGIAGTAAVYPLFYFTNDAAPFWDCLTAVASIVAEYMLCIKLYEAWALYFATDLVSLAILAALDAWITFGTYTVFTFLCLAGIFTWRRSLKRSTPALSLASSTP